MSVLGEYRPIRTIMRGGREGRVRTVELEEVGSLLPLVCVVRFAVKVFDWYPRPLRSSGGTNLPKKHGKVTGIIT